MKNLADALGKLHDAGFQTVGLDFDGTRRWKRHFDGEKIALVLGAEGKGLRQKTRETVTALARLDMPGAIRSLNVSNAAAVALYAARKLSRGCRQAVNKIRAFENLLATTLNFCSTTDGLARPINLSTPPRARPSAPAPSPARNDRPSRRHSPRMN